LFNDLLKEFTLTLDMLLILLTSMDPSLI